MRTLKYAILGLLMQSPVTGYDIAKAFGPGLGSFWSAKHSQIYPELKRLTVEGLIQYSVVMQGERMEKKLYEITEVGKEDFMQWLLQDPPLEPTPKDVFRLRSYYSQWLAEEDYFQLIQNQIEKRMKKYSYLKDRLDRHYKNVDPVTLTGAARGDYLVLSGAVMREQNYLDWLYQCRDLVSRWVQKNPQRCDG
jgi:DNA-binding PadR family transcriptional regulator